MLSKVTFKNNALQYCITLCYLVTFYGKSCIATFALPIVIWDGFAYLFINNKNKQTQKLYF